MQFDEPFHLREESKTGQREEPINGGACKPGGQEDVKKSRKKKLGRGGLTRMEALNIRKNGYEKPRRGG